MLLGVKYRDLEKYTYMLHTLVGSHFTSGQIELDNG